MEKMKKMSVSLLAALFIATVAHSSWAIGNVKGEIGAVATSGIGDFGIGAATGLGGLQVNGISALDAGKSDMTGNASSDISSPITETAAVNAPQTADGTSSVEAKNTSNGRSTSRQPYQVFANTELFKDLVARLAQIAAPSGNNGRSSYSRIEFQDGLRNWHQAEAAMIAELYTMLPMETGSQDLTEVIRLSIKDLEHSNRSLGEVIIAKNSGQIIFAIQQVQTLDFRGMGGISSYAAMSDKQAQAFLAREIPLMLAYLTTGIGSLEPYSETRAAQLALKPDLVSLPNFDGEKTPHK
jgi:hypothetical protein